MKLSSLFFLLFFSLVTIGCRDSQRFDLAGSLDTRIKGFAIEGNYLYTADFTTFTVWNIDEIDNPVQLGSLSDYVGYEITIHDEYALIVDEVNIHVINIKDHSAPAHVTTYTISRGLNIEIALKDSQAFVLSTEGLTIFDVANVDSPQQLNFIPVTDVWDIEIEENLLFLLGQEMQIFEISDPGQLLQISSISLPVGSNEAIGIDNDLLISGNFIYSTANGLVHIINVTDPQNPVYERSLELEVERGRSWPTGLAKQGQLLFVAAWYGGVVAIDISDLSEPKQIDSYSYDKIFISTLIAKDNYVFGAGATNNPIILEIK